MKPILSWVTHIRSFELLFWKTRERGVVFGDDKNDDNIETRNMKVGSN